MSKEIPNFNQKALCPNCKIEFKTWDARQGRFRKYCSEECYKKDTINHKWTCVFPGCKKRYKHHKGLENHITFIHNISVDEYMRKYYCKDIIDSTCFICGSKKEYSLIHSRCKCVNVINKLNRQINSYNIETDDKKKMSYKKSIISLKTMLKQLLTSNTKVKIVEPVMNSIENDLIEIGSYFSGLYQSEKHLYKKADQIRHFKTHNLDLSNKDIELEQHLILNQWSKNNNNPVSIYILFPSKSNGMICYYKNVDINEKKLDQLSTDVFKYRTEFLDYLKNHSSEFEFNYNSHPSWFRYIRNTQQHGIQYRFNPMILLQIWRKLPLPKSS